MRPHRQQRKHYWPAAPSQAWRHAKLLGAPPARPQQYAGALPGRQRCEYGNVMRCGVGLSAPQPSTNKSKHVGTPALPHPQCCCPHGMPVYRHAHAANCGADGPTQSVHTMHQHSTSASGCRMHAVSLRAWQQKVSCGSPGMRGRGAVWSVHAAYAAQRTDALLMARAQDEVTVHVWAGLLSGLLPLTGTGRRQ